jgi:hypothetical protein
MLTLFIGMLFVSLSVLPVAAEPSASITASAAINPSPPPFDLSTSANETTEDKAYHIPILLNNSVEAYIEYFRTRGKNTFQHWLDNSASYLPLMKEIFKNENLPQELAYVAMIESGFDSHAVSRAKAAGPWQFMPDTARQYGLRSDWWIDARKDHIKSTHAAARHFRDLHNRFGSWPLVLAAYNAGTGKVQRAMIRTGSADFWDLRESVFLRRETKGYVPKFMAASIIARDPAAYGFRVPDVKPLRYDEVVIGEGMDLGVVAYCSNSTYEMIKSLNPEINGRVTPPDDPSYLLKIPQGRKKIFLARSDAIRKAAIQVSWEEEVYISLLHQNDSFRDLRNGPDICSVFEKQVTLAERSYQPGLNRNILQGISPLFTGKDGRLGGRIPLKACSGRTQPSDMHQNDGPWGLHFSGNTTDN